MIKLENLEKNSERIKDAVNEVGHKLFKIVQVEREIDLDKEFGMRDLMVVRKGRMHSVINSYLERLDNQTEIINMLLSKFVDLAKEEVEKNSENNDNFLEEVMKEGVQWDYFFESEERRKIIDHIITEDKSKRPTMF